MSNDSSGTRPEVIIYTDGACRPNPGVGGWAAIVIAPNHGYAAKELRGGERKTTNNRMELLAAIRGLETLKRPCRVTIVTDSQYLQRAFTEGWLRKWKQNGWRTAAGGGVRNVDLWRALDQLSTEHDLLWKWVRGHSGDPLNARADALAVAAREEVCAKSSRR